jgi:hypothetical protein
MICSSVVSFFVLFLSFEKAKSQNIATCVISKYAGTGTAGVSGDSGPALSATLTSPAGVYFEQLSDSLVVPANSLLRKIAHSSTTISTSFTSTGTSSDALTGVSSPNPTYIAPQATCGDTTGALYLIYVTASPRVVKILPNAPGILIPYAGTGTAPADDVRSALLGDGGRATAAQFTNPNSCALDRSGKFYLAVPDKGKVRVVNKVSGNDIITSLPNNVGTLSVTGNGGPVTSATFTNPYSLYFNNNTNSMYMTDTSYIRRIDLTTNKIYAIAGNGKLISI